jgi:hypothetical protein
MGKKILKHFCIYNTQTREIMNVRTVDVETLVSEELLDWSKFSDDTKALLWEYEKKRYETGAQGLGSAYGWCAYCGDIAFSWDAYDAEKAKAVKV